MEVAVCKLTTESEKLRKRPTVVWSVLPRHCTSTPSTVHPNRSRTNSIKTQRGGEEGQTDCFPRQEDSSHQNS